MRLTGSKTGSKTENPIKRAGGNGAVNIFYFLNPPKFYIQPNHNLGNPWYLIDVTGGMV